MQNFSIVENMYSKIKITRTTSSFQVSFEGESERLEHAEVAAINQEGLKIVDNATCRYSSY